MPHPRSKREGRSTGNIGANSRSPPLLKIGGLDPARGPSEPSDNHGRARSCLQLFLIAGFTAAVASVPELIVVGLLLIVTVALPESRRTISRRLARRDDAVTKRRWGSR